MIDGNPLAGASRGGTTRRLDVLAAQVGAGIADPCALGIALVTIAVDAAADADPDRDLLAALTELATPDAVGAEVAEAIVNLVAAAQNTADLLSGMSVWSLYPEARSQADADRMARADLAHARAAVKAAALSSAGTVLILEAS